MTLDVLCGVEAHSRVLRVLERPDDDRSRGRCLGVVRLHVVDHDEDPVDDPRVVLPAPCRLARLPMFTTTIRRWLQAGVVELGD